MGLDQPGHRDPPPPRPYFVFEKEGFAALAAANWHSLRSLQGPRHGHARVVEGVKSFKGVDIHALPTVIFSSWQPCLEGTMTFGDPFEDSGVGAR